MVSADTEPGLDETAAPPAAAIDGDPAQRLSIRTPDLALVRRVAPLAAAVTIIVLLLGALLVWSPWADDDPVDSDVAEAAEARDAALDAATEALVAFNTIDHAHMDETLESWLRLSGGALHRELSQDRRRISAQAARTGVDTSATVLATAVSAFDAAAGRATVVGVLRVRTDPQKGKDRSTTERFRVLVQHVGSTWKITYLEAVKATS